LTHKQVYQLLIHTWNTADFSRTPEWLLENYRSHYGLVDQGLSGTPREAFMNGVKWFRSVTPDFVFNIKFMVEENDMLVGHWEGEGTHHGELLGIKPTGKRFVLRGVDMLRFERGKVVEVWHIEDLFGAMRQLQST
jgi:predicted ester cyclase